MSGKAVSLRVVLVMSQSLPLLGKRQLRFASGERSAAAPSSRRRQSITGRQ